MVALQDSRTAMQNRILLAIMALLSCAGPHPSSATGAPESGAESSFATGGPLLGAGFGGLITIEAKSALDRSQHGQPEAVLLVRSINGERTLGPLQIPWTYGGWQAEVPEAAGLGGFRIDVGRAYVLRGYEAGAWQGVPRDVVPVLLDAWGPVQAKGFHFRNVFRVIDGELVADASR